MEGRRNTSGLDVLLEVWSRRKWLAILVFIGPFAVTVSLAISLPHLYRSTATLLLERPQVSETFVKSSVTSELETRLHTISQEILSRSKLQEMIIRFDLYPELRKQATLEDAVERMRRDIRMEFKGRDIRMESTVGAPQVGPVAAIAFTLSFRGRDSDTVANVTNTLASLFVEENLKLRERQAAGTAEFLRVQLEETKKKLDQEEQLVTEFKERHLGELPEQTPVNLTVLERLNMELRLNHATQIQAMEWLDREDLTRQLAMASKNAPPRDQTDPAPVRDPTDPPTGPIAIAARIAWLNQELTELRTRFSEKYPDVIRVKAEIAALERQLAEMRKDGTSETKTDSTTNHYPARLGKVRNASATQLSSLKEQEKSLRQAIAMYQRRVDNAPRLEQEYQELFGDYKTMKEHYNTLQQRYQEAVMAASLEHGEKGDQVRLLDSAIPSTRPAAPNPLRLIAIGLILSLGLAGVAVWLIERRDTSFHTLTELEAFTKVPVLARIPSIVTKTDTSRWHRRFWLGTAAALVGLAIFVGVTHHIAQGNEQLVWMLESKRS